MDDYIETLKKVLSQVRISNKNLDKTITYEDMISEIVKVMVSAKKSRNKVFFIGNGGSAGIALHMAADYQKTAGIKTQTFYDPTLLTCLANDYGYEYVFSKPLALHAEPGDVLIAISSSGESQNILNAVKAAAEHKCTILTFTGFKRNNTLQQAGDINVYVPIEEYGIVESVHNLILQQVIDVIKFQMAEGKV